MAREYIDLSSLLPEQLHSADSLSGTTSNIVILPESTYETHKRKKRQIPDIATWVQVFSTYMLALAPHFPDQLTELIAYQLLIVQHARKFEYPSWLHYDTDFRQWAAANHYTTWSQIHPQFYAYAFTAHGKGAAWCPICHTDGGNHTYDCPKFQVTGPQKTSPHPYVQQKLPIPRSPGILNARQGPPANKKSRPEHCILYNKYNGSCPYGDGCKYTHRCSYCSQPGHPVASCQSKKQ